jgi:hypothetical protein
LTKQKQKLLTATWHLTATTIDLAFAGGCGCAAPRLCKILASFGLEQSDALRPQQRAVSDLIQQRLRQMGPSGACYL